MSNNSVVSLRLQLKGQAGAELRKIGQEQTQSTAKVNQNWTKIAQTQTRVVQIAKQGMKATQATSFVSEQLLRTNKTLEYVTKQQTLQFKQQQSAARGIAKSYKEVEQSTKQIQRNQHGSSGSNLRQVGRFAAGVAGGVMAGGMALQRPVRDTMQYEKELAQLSITAYDNPADRKQGQDTLRNMLARTSKEYGQTTDDSMTGLNALIGSGKYAGKTKAETEANLQRALSAAAEAAQASGGDILDFAQLSIAAKNKGLDERKYMSLAVQAGKEGNFETRDLARYLSLQSGMLPSDPANQLKQAGQLMALNQVAMSTAGSTDQAGNNVVNLLSKMNADSTKKTFKKEYGIDLEKEYLTGAANGKTRFDVFGESLKKAMMSDDRYKKVLSELEKAPNGSDKAAILESKQGILEQSALSNVLPDMQALSAGVAMVTQWDELQRVAKASDEKGLSSLEADAATMRDTAGFNVNKLAVTKKDSEFKAMQDFTHIIGDTASTLSDYADKYPALSTALAGTTVAFQAIAAGGLGAAAGASVSDFLDTAQGGVSKVNEAGIVSERAAGKLEKAGQVLGAATLAWQAGQAIGTAAYEAMEGTEIGDRALDAIGHDITETLAFFGNDNAQAALDSMKSYEDMLKKQEQQNSYTEQTNKLLGQLITAVNANGQPVLSFSTAPILSSLNNQTNQEANRHGNVPFYLQRR